MVNNKNFIKNIKISLVFNIIIAVLTLLAAIFMFTGFKFMDEEPLLESTKLGIFKFFTVDSNLFMAIVAIIFAIKEISVLRGKSHSIGKNYYILKLMGTSAVALTFLVVFCYLGFIVEGGVIRLLKNNNLFLHLIIPLLSIFTFIFFEKNNKITIKNTLWGALPAVIYSIFYTINVLTHIENGSVSIQYDFYAFVQGGLWQIAIVIPLMYLFSYIISLTLWTFNRKKK